MFICIEEWQFIPVRSIKIKIHYSLAFLDQHKQCSEEIHLVASK